MWILIATIIIISNNYSAFIYTSLYTVRFVWLLNAFCHMSLVILRDAQVMDCTVFFSGSGEFIHDWCSIIPNCLTELSIGAKGNCSFPSMCSFSKLKAKPVLGRSAESDNKSMIDITSHKRLVSFSLLMGWKLLRWKRNTLISLQVTMTTASRKKETQSAYLPKCQMLA